jgi:hypothetical protein
MSLPIDKYKEWSADIRKMIAGKSSRGDKLHNTVGRLNHAGFIIPTAQHFLARICDSKNTYPTKEAIGQIPRVVLEDLHLWLDFPRVSPQRNQLEHLDDQRDDRRANNSLLRRRMQARNRRIESVFYDACLARFTRSTKPAKCLARFTRSTKLAKILIRAKSRLASERNPGATNKAADSLSRTG